MEAFAEALRAERGVKAGRWVLGGEVLGIVSPEEIEKGIGFGHGGYKDGLLLPMLLRDGVMRVRYSLGLAMDRG